MDIKNFKNEISTLKKENDSLKKILTEIDKKFVFDKVIVRDIPSYKNTGKMNSTMNGEFVFVGYNDDDDSNIIIVDSISYNPKKLNNPDTLIINKNGGYSYSIKLDSRITRMKGAIELKNNYGKELTQILTKSIKAKE